MKLLPLTLFTTGLLFLISCKKESLAPVASFTFRNDTTHTLRIATYDTCSLFSNSTGGDSTKWDLGNGTTVKGDHAVLSYTTSGTYTVTLTVTAGNGKQSTAAKKVIVLDRILKKITVKKIYWNPVPNSIPYFNAIWPQTDSANIYVQFRKYTQGDSVAPYSGLMPNSPVLFTSQTVGGVPHQYDNPFNLPFNTPFVIDKKMLLDRSLAFFLMAKDATGAEFSIQCSHESGASWGMNEDFAHNKFMIISSLFSSVELDGDYE